MKKKNVQRWWIGPPPLLEWSISQVLAIVPLLKLCKLQRSIPCGHDKRREMWIGFSICESLHKVDSTRNYPPHTHPTSNLSPLDNIQRLVMLMPHIWQPKKRVNLRAITIIKLELKRRLKKLMVLVSHS